jgi:hypothetical protein
MLCCDVALCLRVRVCVCVCAGACVCVRACVCGCNCVAIACDFTVMLWCDVALRLRAVALGAAPAAWAAGDTRGTRLALYWLQVENIPLGWPTPSIGYK